eukprot:65429-Hanusia_phi.AAC.5
MHLHSRRQPFPPRKAQILLPESKYLLQQQSETKLCQIPIIETVASNSFKPAPLPEAGGLSRERPYTAEHHKRIATPFSSRAPNPR